MNACVRGRVRVTALVFALTAIVEPSASFACVSPDYPKGVTVKMVGLPKMPVPPYYYVRTFDYNYFIAFEASALDQLLSSGAVYGGQDLLKDIKAGARPLGNVDLSVYVLAKPEHFSTIQRLSVVGLERAAASVVSLPDGSGVPKVKMRVDNSSSGFTIRFDASGSFLVWEIRCIAD